MGRYRDASGMKTIFSGLAASLTLLMAATTQAQDTDARADALVKQMTQAEKLQLVFGFYATPSKKDYMPPAEVISHSAGFVPGIARLNIPNQWQTDAGLGVASHRTMEQPRLRTALPSGIATAATWNPEIALAGGQMIGNEARLSGFNVMLSGGANLLREPRNGRNFEYAGEDPYLAGIMAGTTIKGIQSNHIVATTKHFALNDQETNRHGISADITENDARQTDLLAFQIAIETGQPGSVMCSYNRVNGTYACENDWLLNTVLKSDWGYKGYVMSDWGAVHSTIPAALNGLDQESGYFFDASPYFGDAMKEAVADGHISEARLDDMARRIVRSLAADGVLDDPVKGDRGAEIDYKAHANVTQADAEQAIVLLKNTAGLLPLKAKRIAVIGGHADVGVLSGGGSSQVYPYGAPANGRILPNEGPNDFPGPMVWYPSSPLKALAAHSRARVTYADGKDLKAAVRAARGADVVVVFATQWTGEQIDVTSLNLPGDQDALITAVARANPKTVVVLETGGPVVMPWIGHAAAVLEAWYPGTSGGEAIARVLTGEVNPSGHLPATFPVSEAQLPRPKLDGSAEDQQARVDVDYRIEGSAVGYKWFDKKGIKPLFPFGYGLSYTTFKLSGLKAQAVDGTVHATATVTNSGARAGMAVAQIYVSGDGWEAPKRLGGWAKVALKPGESKTVEVTVDPRLLSTADGKAWVLKGGDYKVILASSAADPIATTTVHLDGRTLDAAGH